MQKGALYVGPPGRPKAESGIVDDVVLTQARTEQGSARCY
jgi:hypothetical protein